MQTTPPVSPDLIQVRAKEEIDRCEAEILRKQRVIAEKQKFIDLVGREVEELKKRKATIEFIMSGTRPTPEPVADENQGKFGFHRNGSASPMPSGPLHPRQRFYNNTGGWTLKGSVMDILRNDSKNGLSVAEICEKLRGRGFEATPNFYQVVYSACIRLASDPRATFGKKEEGPNVLFFSTQAQKNPAERSAPAG